MRLHRLTLTAIGPFADTQTVDFDRLCESGLFLLEGPTGAGKSTVLDALTFALYGGLAGEEADAARLHSHFADADTTPEVTLVFSLAGRKFRIRRTPAHLRPKKRGDGFTQERSSAMLQREIAGRYELVSDRQDEIGHLIEQELGLNRAQFTQVVLLPQGEFARFLRSNDESRRTLLTKLFGAERFDRITAWLKQEAQSARSEQRDADVAVGEALAAAVEAGRVDAATAEEWKALSERWSPDGQGRLLAALHTYAGEMEAEATRAAKALGQAEAFLTKTSQRRDSLASEETRIRRLAEARERESRHELGASDHQENKAAFSAAQRAGSVRPLVAGVEAARGRLVERQKEAVTVAGGEDELAALGVDWSALQDGARSDAETASSLERIAILERELPERRRSLEELGTSIATGEGELPGLRGEQADLPEQIERQEQMLTDARVAAGGRSALESQLAQWRGRADALSTLADLTPQLADATSRRDAAIDAHQKAVDEHQRLMEARLARMTGELAEKLVDGEPCQVCGSPDHPVPADRATVSITDDQIQQAAAARDTAQGVREAAETRWQDFKTREARELAKVEDSDGSEVEAEIRRLTAELDTATEQAEQVAALERNLAELKGRATTVAEHIQEQQKVLAGLRSDQKALSTAIAADEQTVTAAAAGFESVAARVSALQQTSRRLTDAAEAVRAVEESGQLLLQAEEAARSEATAQGFADLDSACDAMLGPLAMAELEQVISAWEAEKAAVAELLAAPDLAEVDVGRAALVEQELADAIEAHDAAQARCQTAVSELSGLTDRVSRFDERRAEVRARLAERESLARTQAPLLDLDRLARGQANNALAKMTLTTYVLRLWFDQVVRAANNRLNRIAGGKYELRRTEEAGKGNAQVGLGLTVLDRHTGRERSPQSLSGGETFYTSLALASGLADVVQAEAGGVSLDTLFIDEGFGSLDSDTLEEVLTVIDGLRDNGRVVGIVSHVEELKERVPERLQISRPRDEGPSQLRVVA